MRALLIALNLVLLSQTAWPDEFTVDALAVSPAARGLGIGKRLIYRAEDKARTERKGTMSLGVIGENAGAFRLYERLGLRTTHVWRSKWLGLAFRSREVQRIEKTLTGG